MGPRPRGRGISQGIASGSVSLRWPSMGPRPRGRGIFDKAHAWNPIRLSFNGAATARSRNLNTTATFARRPVVPSMGPRPRGRGIPDWHVHCRSLVPSMGPRPRGRGIKWVHIAKGENLACPSMGPRPRGRGITTSNTIGRAKFHAFNGAATARSRNFTICVST